MYKLVSRSHPALHKKAKSVEEFTHPRLLRLISGMKEIMMQYRGIGLAAPQIGKSIRVFVVDRELIKKSEEENDSTKLRRLKRLFKKKQPDVFINPVIRSISGKGFLLEEGCLSISGIFGTVPRAREIVVEALNERGRKFKVRATGLYAHVLQHEIDHLNGALFIERVVEGSLHKLKNKS